MATDVTIETREVGQGYGCEAVIRSARTWQVLARTITRPFGAQGTAIADAEAVCAVRGYVVVDRDSEA